MEIGVLDRYDITTANVGLNHIQRNKIDSESPEKLFESIILQLLTENILSANSESGGVLGLDGPWKNLIFTALCESLTNVQTTAYGRLVTESTYHQEVGELK